MKKTAITFGLLSGLIIIIYSAAVFIHFGDFAKMTSQDLSKVEMLGYLRYLILLLTIVFAIRYFKKQAGDAVTFKPLFLAGLYTAFIVALLVGLMEATYMLINPDFMEQYGELVTNRMKEQGASAAALAEHQKEMDNFKWMANPAAMGIFYFLETAVIGTVISLIVALIARTKKMQPVMA